MSTYTEVIQDTLDEVGEEDKTADISSESIQGYILQGCQQIAQRVPIEDRTELRLIYGVTEYNFANSTVPVIATGTIDTLNNTVTGVTSVGTGTISTSGKDVTGVSTLFMTELAVGKMIIVGTQKKTVLTITSNTACTIDAGFDSDLSASAFSYSTTKFTKEVVVGSTIISNSISKVVESITDAYNMTVTVPYTIAQSGQAFTVDTKVTEIPTKFNHITRCERLEGVVPRPIWVAPHEKLLREKNQTWGITGYYGGLYQPYMISEWVSAGTKYLEIFPEIETDKQITLYGFIRVNPRDYATDALTASIPLSQDYEPAIREYAKYRIYKRIKDEKGAQEAFALFENYVKILLVNLPTRREVTVDYL